MQCACTLPHLFLLGTGRRRGASLPHSHHTHLSLHCLLPHTPGASANEASHLPPHPTLLPLHLSATTPHCPVSRTSPPIAFPPPPPPGLLCLAASPLLCCHLCLLCLHTGAYLTTTHLLLTSRLSLAACLPSRLMPVACLLTSSPSFLCLLPALSHTLHCTPPLTFALHATSCASLTCLSHTLYPSASGRRSQEDWQYSLALRKRKGRGGRPAAAQTSLHLVTTDDGDAVKWRTRDSEDGIRRLSIFGTKQRANGRAAGVTFRQALAAPRCYRMPPRAWQAGRRSPLAAGEENSSREHQTC